MKLVVFPHLQQGCAPQTARKVCRSAYRNHMEIWADPETKSLFHDIPYVQYAPFEEAVQDADVAVAIGGDGTILHCAGHLVGTQTKLLGINTGRMGFLASMESDQVGEIARLQTGDYRVSERMLIRGVLRDEDGEIVDDCYALNDIVVSRTSARVVDITVMQNGELLGQYRADGVIFSTPTGSTAYALSAGGPIIEPEFACIEMTLICPHALSARPILFAPDSDLVVTCQVRGDHDVRLCADGEHPKSFPASHTLEISGSSETIHMLDLSGNTFFNALSRKLMHPLKDGEA